METITPVIVDEKSPLALVIKENSLEIEEAKFLVTSFEPLLKKANDWASKVATINVTDVSQTREMKLARETRLALREVRINTEKVRKSLTEGNVRKNRAINGAANIIKFLVEPLEEKLEAQEKFVELQEAKRKEELKQTRLMLLAPFGTDVSFYSLEEMPENVFQQLLAGEQASAEKRKMEAQRIENERIEKENAQRAEQEKIRLENEKLKKEAQEREVLAKIEREKAEKALKEAQEAAKREKEAAAAKAAAELAEFNKKAALVKAEADNKAAQEKAKTDRILKQAQEAREKAEKEARALVEAQKKKEAELAATKLAEENAKKAAEEKAKNAPEKKKLLLLAQDVRDLELPVLSAATDKGFNAELVSQREKFAVWIEKKANSL